MIIRADNVKKSFGRVEALKGISLLINKGDIFGLVGPDGAGKTTFIRTVLGLYEADSGQLELLGEKTPEKVKSKIGYVPQLFSLYQDMTVWENLSLFGSLYEISGELFTARANELLAMTWMDAFKDRLAGNLSGGMKQKLALAAGLLHRPDLLILDEPTTGVDPVSRREFWQLLYRLNKEGLTLVVSTPYMDEVELCHRLAFFHQGEIRAVGSPAELLSQYPYKLFALSADGLRTLLPRFKYLPAKEFYLYGEEMHIALGKEEELALVKDYLAKAGIAGYSLSPIQPTLEDLFSVLSAKEGGGA